jgi:hypothetical protein
MPRIPSRAAAVTARPTERKRCPGPRLSHCGPGSGAGGDGPQTLLAAPRRRRTGRPRAASGVCVAGRARRASPAAGGGRRRRRVRGGGRTDRRRRPRATCRGDRRATAAAVSAAARRRPATPRRRRGEFASAASAIFIPAAGGRLTYARRYRPRRAADAGR